VQGSVVKLTIMTTKMHSNEKDLY